MDGAAVGLAEGVSVGLADGEKLGMSVGLTEGFGKKRKAVADGCKLMDGSTDGDSLGDVVVGRSVGLFVGPVRSVGVILGAGDDVGATLGSSRMGM
jgi:hypothetical protein